MAKRKLSPTFTVCEVQTTARPRSTAGTLTATISSSLTDAPPEPERLVKRTRGDMETEGYSGDREVLPEHPLEYKEDEEESEGQAYLPDQEEEGVAQWLSEHSCEYCGRLEAYSSLTGPQGDYPYCSRFCSDRAWDQMQQERDDHYNWYVNTYAEGSLLPDFFYF